MRLTYNNVAEFAKNANLQLYKRYGLYHLEYNYPFSQNKDGTINLRTRSLQLKYLKDIFFRY